MEETVKLVGIAPNDGALESLVSRIERIGRILWKDGPYPLKRGKGWKIYLFLAITTNKEAEEI